MVSPRNDYSQSTISACGLVPGCNLFAAAVSGIVIEGVKSLAARQALGLEEPQIEGKPISAFLHADFKDERELTEIAIFIGRRAGLGALWIAKNLPDAPNGALASEADSLAAIRRLIGKELPNE